MAPSAPCSRDAQELATARLPGMREAQPDGPSSRWSIGLSGQTGEQRTDEEGATNEDRDRVAGQSDEGRAGDAADRDRLAGLDRDPPEVERAASLHDIPDVISLAHRDAAGGEDQIAIGRRLAQPQLEVSRLVTQDAEIGDIHAGPQQHGAQHRPVGIVDRGRAERLTGLGELVAGGEQRDARTTAHGDLGQSQRRQQTEILRAQAPSRRQDLLPARDILPARRRLAPRLMPDGSVIASPSAATSSCITMVSAPSGTGAPVKMRQAPCSSRAGASPAIVRPSTGRLVAAPAARSAKRMA